MTNLVEKNGFLREYNGLFSRFENPLYSNKIDYNPFLVAL